mgnify:FL=1
MQLPVIEPDKANHFLYGALIACAGTFFLDPLDALALCAAIGVAKEIFDKITHRGTCDALDAVFTVAGGAAVVIPLVAL